ncbi:MAG: hypothetical protein ACFFBF_05100 [Promethearchaeota archaeon]
MKKKILLFLIIVSLMPILVISFGTSRPGYGDTHDVCHDTAGYTIDTTALEEIPAIISSNVIFNITATGSNLFVQAISGAKDNDLFVILPTTDRINESSIHDLDPTPNSIKVIFNVTTPSEDGYYTIFIIAGNDASGQINFAYQQIYINVGGVTAPRPVFNIFDHFGMFLGLPALIFLTLGTILVLVNESKFVKVHGILAGSSWILTLINVVTLVTKNPAIWVAFPLTTHWTHIFLGGFGLLTGLFSMFFGIAAERKPAKITGYITLICWWGAFFFGFLFI